MSPGGSVRRNRKRGVRDRVEELTRVRAGDLLPNPRRWRLHPPAQRAALRALLKEIGYADALLARRDGDRMVLIDGHLRQGLDPNQVVPVLVLDVTEEEADTLLATLDPLACMVEPDPEALSLLLQRVHSSSRAVMDLLADLAKGAGLPAAVPLRDPEEVPPPPRVPNTKRGDLWILGEHRLLCGDATNREDMARLMGGDRAEAMWTDPPYGVDYVGKTPRALRITGDGPSGLNELLAGAICQAGKVLGPGARIYVAHPAGPLSVVFLQAFLAQGWRLHQTLVWVKDCIVLGHGDYHYRHEPIAFGYVPGPGRWGRGASGWYGGNDQSSVIEVPRPAASREHPTTKPVELIRRCLVNSTKEGNRVLDPFCGSGSTLIACEVMGRAGYGMEIDPPYCDVAVARWEALTGRKATLGSNP
jgi:DNA modification methylase